MPKSAKRRGSSILALESLSCPAYFGTTDGFKTLQKSIQTSCQVSISYQPVELYMTYQHRCEVYIPEPHVGPSEFPYPDLLNAKVPPRYRSAQSGLPYHSLRRLGRQGGGHWTQQVACDNFLGRICLEHLSPGKKCLLCLEHKHGSCLQTTICQHWASLQQVVSPKNQHKATKGHSSTVAK